MFFDGLGIDLYFLFEGDTNSHVVAQTFACYQNAGKQLGRNGTTLVAAFLLNEIGRTITRYNANPTDGQEVDLLLNEVVRIGTAHTCDRHRFLVRIWRPHKLRDTTWKQNSNASDTIFVRAVRRGSAGQSADPLFEGHPVAFPVDQSSIWIDAGLASEFPMCDISITGK